jgi:NAD(P)-dependent dehydrogenase (short-subunit alcohol dehydrogenase family)
MTAMPFGELAGRPLPGRVGLITRAGRGIGRAVALALADSGAKVVLGARTLGQVENVASEVIPRGGGMCLELELLWPRATG